MRRRWTLIAAGVLVTLPGWSACRSSPEPETLFAEAEQLRLRYEKAASQQAIAKYQAAMAAWKRTGNRRRAARAGQQMAVTHEQLGAWRDSLKSHVEALSLARDAGDGLLESEIRGDVGTVQAWVADSADEFEEARRQCQAALELARGLKAYNAEAKALDCLGEVAYWSQHLEQALESYVEAAQLWDSLGDQRGQARTLLHQGYVYSDLMRFDQARTCYERARSIWTALGDRREQAIALVADARLLSRRGEYQEAQNEFEAALSFLKPMGDTVWEGASLTGIGDVYLAMAETRAALQYWERALQILETAGLRSAWVDALFTLGKSYLAAGDDTKALRRFEQALGLAGELGIQRWEAFALRLIGVVHLVRHDPRLAQQYLERSLTVQQSPGSPGDSRLRAQTLADMGEAFELLGNHEAATRHLDTALVLSQASGDRASEARALFGLARASMGLNRPRVARGYIDRSLQVVESLRTAVESRDLRASYFASIYRYYEFQMDVLMRLHRIRPKQGLAAAAFEASERARARSLLDSLAEAGVNLRTRLDPGLLKREQIAKAAFDDWARRQGRGEGAGAAVLAEEYRDLEQRWDQLQAEIRSKSPHYAALAQPRPLRVQEVQKEVVDGGTLLLEYALGDERSYLWAVSSRDQTSYELPPRAEIEGAAQRVYERLTARLVPTGNSQDRRQRVMRADAEYWTEAARLSEVLLGPVAKRMAGKRILVVADGALQYLPFAALPVPGRSGEPVPMVVEHEIVSLPSASVLAVLRRETKARKPPEKVVAVLADPVFEADDPRLPVVRADGPSGGDGRSGYPRLAATRQEADAIVGLAPEGMTLRAVDFDASRATAMSPDLARYRILHFATHGVLNNETPGLSAVLLSTFDRRGRAVDGSLRLHDIYGLELPAELVVLSACSTALGKPVRGEGLVGIVRGFMHAGAKRVLASLWKVDDEATGEMMSRLYLEMLQRNRSPAAALREAQLSLWRQDRWRPPYYWAAFVLQGEWR